MILLFLTLTTSKSFLKGIIITHVSSNKVVLTFDDYDYAGKNIEQILDILKKYNVKAVFFPTATWANGPGKKYIQRMIDEGHLVCNHTKDHKVLTTLSTEKIKEEIVEGININNCNLLRPPYGAYNYRVLEVASELGYKVYLWSVDTQDWLYRYPGGDKVIYYSAIKAKGGSIILMHMHSKNTVLALPKIIEYLQSKGYELHY